MAIARGTNVVSVCLTEKYIYINNTSAIYESQMNETWCYWVTGYVYTSWLRSSFFEPTYFSEIGQEIRLTFWTRCFSLLSSPCIHWDVTKVGWQLIGVRSVLTVPFIEYRMNGWITWDENFRSFNPWMFVVNSKLYKKHNEACCLCKISHTNTYYADYTTK